MTEVVQPAFNVTVALALEMVQAAMARATELARPMSIAVVDSGGNLKAFARMDGSPLLGAGVAQQKAWSAVSWNMPTTEWYPFIKDDPVLVEGVPRIPGLSMLPGGFPIRVDGELVGGIGVSGSHYSHDADVARAAFAVSDRIQGDTD
jgi:uncharacterized protein GlcG (DUF336 family)